MLENNFISLYRKYSVKTYSVARGDINYRIGGTFLSRSRRGGVRKPRLSCDERMYLPNIYTVKESFLTGSYSRSTMIAPLNDADVDIFAVLDVSYYHHYNGQNGGQAGLLDLVKRTLRKTYTKTPDISRI